MKLFIASLPVLLLSTVSFATDIRIRESGVGSGVTAAFACFDSDDDAKNRALHKCQGVLTSKYCSQSPSRFGNTYSCISMCEFICRRD